MAASTYFPLHRMALRIFNSRLMAIMKILPGLPTAALSVSAQSGTVATGCMSCALMGPARQKFLMGKGRTFNRYGQRADEVERHNCCRNFILPVAMLTLLCIIITRLISVSYTHLRAHETVL